MISGWFELSLLVEDIRQLTISTSQSFRREASSVAHAQGKAFSGAGSR